MLLQHTSSQGAVTISLLVSHLEHSTNTHECFRPLSRTFPPLKSCVSVSVSITTFWKLAPHISNLCGCNGCQDCSGQKVRTNHCNVELAQSTRLNNGDFSFCGFCITKLVHFKCFVLLSNNIYTKAVFSFFTASAFIWKIKNKIRNIFKCFVIV